MRNFVLAMMVLVFSVVNVCALEVIPGNWYEVNWPYEVYVVDTLWRITPEGTVERSMPTGWVNFPDSPFSWQANVIGADKVIMVQSNYDYYHGVYLVWDYSQVHPGAESVSLSIGKIDAERFKNQHLGRKSACTVSRGIRRCRSFFKFAVDAGWLQSNPFKEIPTGVEVNLKRQVYVDRDMIYKVMEHCRDDYDRLLLALARFGDLRSRLSWQKCNLAHLLLTIRKDLLEWEGYRKLKRFRSNGT